MGPEGLDALIAAALAALTEEGEGFTISSAHGAVLLPRDARTLAAAMRLADQRMYQQKARGRASASRQSSDVLMRVLLERSPELGEHLQGVTALAERVGRRLGLDEVALGHLVRAAGLHDVGKVAIPESILTKPGPARRRGDDLRPAPHADRGAHPPGRPVPRSRGAPGAGEPRALGRRRAIRTAWPESRSPWARGSSSPATPSRP